MLSAHAWRLRRSGRYSELQPFRKACSRELKASLFPAGAGTNPNKLLETCLDRLTMYTGVDAADQTFTALALGASQEILSSPKRPYYRAPTRRLLCPLYQFWGLDKLLGRPSNPAERHMGRRWR